MLEIFNDEEEVEVFMSEKSDGDMRLFSANFELNRKKYLSKNNLNYKNLFSAKLEHGANVEIVDDMSRKFIDYTDGLLTNNPGLILSVTSADCLPIFLFDPVRKVVGILHCGWRGIANGIIKKAINKMRDSFNSLSEDILIGIGPGIQKCHFEVGDIFLKKFNDSKGFARVDGNRKYFDLKSFMKNELILNGIHGDNIGIDSRCSFCDKNLWSYRRDRKEFGGVQVAIAGIKLK